MPAQPLSSTSPAVDISSSNKFSDALSVVQRCLNEGKLLAADQAIRAATFQCVSRENERELAICVLRRKLMSGRYQEWEDPEGVWQRTSSRWKDDPQINALHKALFCAAGWSEFQQDAPIAIQELLLRLISPECTEIERIYPQLATVGQALHINSARLADAALLPLPREMLGAVGERVLPPSLEALLVELWYAHSFDEPYPRAELIVTLAENEVAFSPVANLIRFFKALQDRQLQEASWISEAFFAKQDYIFWLRSLPIIIHFGSSVQISALPGRLNRLLRLAEKSDNLSLRSLLSEYISQLIDDGFLVGQDKTTQGKVTLTPNLTAQKPHKLAAPTQNKIPFWSVAGSSPGLNAFFSQCLAEPLSESMIKQLAYSTLLQAHEFTRALHLSSLSEAAKLTEGQDPVILTWLALPRVFREQTTYQQALLDYLQQRKRSSSLIELMPLLDTGISDLQIAGLLSEQGRLDLFLIRPSRDYLGIINAIPKGKLSSFWLLLLEAALRLRSEWPADSDAEVLIKRLCSAPELPAPNVAQLPGGLERVADVLEKLPLDSLLLSVAMKIALRLGYSKQHESALKVLTIIRSKYPAKTASVSSHLWLKTGHSQYLEPDIWTAFPDAWTAAAGCWQQMLSLATVGSEATYPQNEKLPAALPPLFKALQAWLLQIKTNLILTAFPDQKQLDAAARDWAFIAPCASGPDKHSPAEKSTSVPLFALLEAARESISEPSGASSAEAVLVSYAAGIARAEHAAVTLAKTAADSPACYDDLLLKCRGVLSPSFVWQLRKSLLALEQDSRAKELDKLSPPDLSATIKKAISLPLSTAHEKPIRLALQSAEPKDFNHPQTWLAVADFLRSSLFSPCCGAQWKMISTLREKLRVEDQSAFQQALSVLDDEDQSIIDRILLQPLKPILIDASNLIYDAAIHPFFEDGFDFVERLWEPLASAHFYPILTYIDKKGTTKFNPKMKQHLNRLIDETKIEPTTGFQGDASTADYRILKEVGEQRKEHAPLVLTNDYFAKPYNSLARLGEPNGWMGHPDFSWFNQTVFDAMQVRLTPGTDADSWQIVMPDKKQLSMRRR